MKKCRRYGLSALLAISMTLIAAFPGWAEKEERIPVGEVILSIESDIEAGESGGSVDANVESGECEVDRVEITNEKEIWSGGDEPKVKIYLSAENGYYFAKKGKNMFGLIGDKAKYVTSKTANDKETLILTVELDELEEGDLYVYGLVWDAQPGVASWDLTEGAKKYRVRLVRGDTSIGSIYTTTGNSYNLAGLIDREGVYYFKVQPVDFGGYAGDWQESGSLYVKKEDLDTYKEAAFNNREAGIAGPGSGSWKQDETGWWYQHPDNTYPANNWEKIGGEWYFFDGRGYMQTGWINWNGKWYYCDPESGAMWSERTTPDGYRVGSDGARIN